MNASQLAQACISHQRITHIKRGTRYQLLTPLPTQSILGYVSCNESDVMVKQGSHWLHTSQMEMDNLQSQHLYKDYYLYKAVDDTQLYLRHKDNFQGFTI